jgi:hypothetical protein
MAGGRVRVNTGVFYNDYRDLQVQSFISPGVIDISNAGSATIRGVEVEAAAAFERGVQLAGHFSWLDATYDRYLFRGPGSVTWRSTCLIRRALVWFAKHVRASVTMYAGWMRLCPSPHIASPAAERPRVRLRAVAL